MPATLEREQLAKSIMELSDDEFKTVTEFVRRLRDEEPPLSDDELAQLAEADEDSAAGRVTSWAEAKKRLEALP